MNIITKIWVLLLWAQTLTFVKCQDYCEKLQDVKLTVKSIMVKERYDDGEVIEYVCNAPRMFHGGSATCVNSRWHKTVECPVLTCEVGALTTGLKINGFPPRNNRATGGQKLKFFCQDTYDIEGSEETECLETGQWREPFPTCSEKCLIPKIPDDLRIIQSGVYLSKGESITFECRKHGYFPEGNEKIECLGNGQWSGVPPTCEKKCLIPEIPEDLHITQSRVYLSKGESLTFECSKHGYFTVGNEKIECLANGQWSGILPTCERKCQVPTLPEYVLIRPAVQGDRVRTGQILGFGCSVDGFSIQGNVNIECLEDGQWNRLPPTCEGSVCREPPLLEDGDTVGIDKPQYELNERVQYMCQNRYTMQGGPYKTCTRGVWTGEIKCLKPCIVDADEMNRRNIQYAYGYENRLYPPHNDYITFACKGWRHSSSDPMRIKCIDGVMNLPTCQ